MGNIHINHLAVITATISTFLLAAIWWSPIMFEKAWKKECGLTDELLKKANMIKIYGLAFVFSLIMAYNLAFFVGSPDIDVMMGSVYGFLTGFGWVAMGVFVLGLFELKTWKYMLINAGYMIVSFTTMGAILGAWK